MAAIKGKILVVDDEPDAIELIAFHLRNAGFDVASAANGDECLEQVQVHHPALIVLDIAMPGMDGFEVCKALRRNAGTEPIPILVLTARTAEIDRLLALELGADDYVTKPFSPRELVLRVKALLRRSQSAACENSDHLGCGILQIDIPRHEVTVEGRRVAVTTTEFRLLVALTQRCGHVFSRERLLADVWHCDESIDSRTVDTHIGRLRDKLGNAAPYIESVRGIGYRCADQ